MKVVFADQAIYEEYIPHLDALAPLKGRAEIAAYDESPVDDDLRCERLRDADVIVFGVHKLENAFLARLNRLKMLQFMGTGYANFVDPEFCAASGIILAGTEDYGSNAVAEFALSQAFTLARNTAAADRCMRDGHWTHKGLEGMEIEGCTFGVLGTGNIGRLVAKKAHALGANVIACDVCESDELKRRYRIPYTGIDELFRRSDILSLHVKYLPETKMLVSGRLIGMMKNRSLLVNCSRAEVVDYAALEKALIEKRIRGAALDVFCNEPLQDFSICRLPNVITSPHIGYFTGKAKGKCLKMCVESIIERMSIA